MHRKPVRIHLAAESFAVRSSGIARLARLTAKVLADERRLGHADVSGVALNDETPAEDLGISIRAAAGSRSRFVAQTHFAAFDHDYFIYDFLGMARAHCRVPLLRRPFMTFICGIEVWEEAAPYRIAWARRADELISISEYSKQRAEICHGGFQRANVCWLATEEDDPPEQAGISNGPPTVLIIARIDHPSYKGHQELIDAWPSVVSAVPDARLVVAGDGPGRDALQRRAAALGCGDQIEFRGFIPAEKVEQLWREATVFAMPSRGEGFGLVYIEAMRHAIPVIASVHDAAQEINVDGQTGFNVNLDTTDELSDRIVTLLRDPEVASALGRQGQDRWQEHFAYSAFRRRFQKILNDFVSRN